MSTATTFAGLTPRYLFNRSWSVTITPYVASGYDKYGNALYLPSTEAQLFQADEFGNNLKITFDFTKTSEGQSNKGKVEVWNMNATSRKIFQKGAQVLVKAGYLGYIKTIFSSDILSTGVKTERRGADVVTTFEGGSSERQIEQNIISKTYPPGTLYASMVNDCANTLGVSFSIIQGIDENAIYNQAVTFCSTVKVALDYLTISNGLVWHVQDDELIILPKGQPINNSQAIFLSTGTNAQGQQTNNTGLIGIPSRAEDGLTYFSALLNPDIYPGIPVQLESENVNGLFLIQTANLKGDSHGKEWQIDCVCTEIIIKPPVANQLGAT